MLSRAKLRRLRSKLGLELLPGATSGIGPKVFVVRDAKATTSNLAYKCFTAWKEVSGPFSIRAEGTI